MAKHKDKPDDAAKVQAAEAAVSPEDFPGGGTEVATVTAVEPAPNLPGYVNVLMHDATGGTRRYGISPEKFAELGAMLGITDPQQLVGREFQVGKLPTGAAPVPEPTTPPTASAQAPRPGRATVSFPETPSVPGGEVQYPADTPADKQDEAALAAFRTARGIWQLPGRAVIAHG